MHGQRRDKYKARLKDEKIANALQVKATQWFQLTKVLVHKRHNDNDDNDDTMNLIEKLLLVNPDPIHLWNHRRDLLLLGESNNNNNNFSIEKELILTRQALERNPKAYGPWFHRKWSIGYCLKQQQQQHVGSLLEKEVALTEQFLMLDERNFHCWNYRRFLIGCQMEILLLLKEMNEEGKTLSTKGIFDGHWPQFKNVMTTKSYQMGPQVGVTTSSGRDDNDDKNTPQQQQQMTLDSSHESSLQLFHELLKKEWDFTTTKMTQNFSNGSALHYRLQLLLLLFNSSTSSKKEDENENVEKELELCHDAIFTEPDDQTTWWYYKELIKFDIMNKNQELIQSEIDLLHELLDSEEQNCKWAWIGLNCLLEQKQQEQMMMMSGKEKDNDNDGESTTTTTIATIKEQRKNVYENLIRLDPDRQNRYRYLMKKLE